MKYLYFIILLLFSCHHLEEGRVISHSYEPSNEWMYYSPIISGKVTIMVPVYVYDDEDYILEIEGIYNGKKRVEKWYVTETQYNCLRNGDKWVRTVDCSLSDDASPALHEHLYYLEDAFNMLLDSNVPVTAEGVAEVVRLQELCIKKKAAYIRLVTE